MAALGYFLTFRTYGSWLHGHTEGSVDRQRNVYGTPLIPPDQAWLIRREASLKHPAVELSAGQRFVVDAAIREVVTHRGWRLSALNVRTTHVHAVVVGAATPEKMMADFKAYATRRMREAGVVDRDVQPWAHHGSTRHLHNEQGFIAAVRYVLEEQGAPLPMVDPGRSG
ncbi:MAG: hypothetical protein K2Q20_08300 [Phycisphaerales bacterium]|nr:hypothetical protein [Phycisphaerales bacterium]